MPSTDRMRTRTLWGLPALSLAMGAALFAYLCFGGPLDAMAHNAPWQLGALIALVTTGALLSCAVLCRDAQRPQRARRRFLLRAALLLLALLARLTLFDNVTADYDSFLSKWVDVFRQGGFAMLTQEIGDYNLPYQYILALIACSDIHDLYLIKLVSVAFDFAIALLMMRMTERFIDQRFSLPVFFVVLFSPTVLLNSAYWAQCDTLYVFFVLLSLYLMLGKKPVGSVIAMAIAFSFKLQTIFFFPMALFGLLHGRYKLRHALLFPIAYVATLTPALLLGRSLSSALMIYVNQSVGQYSERLTYNAGNLYQFFPTLLIGDDSSYRWLFKALPEVLTGTEHFLNSAVMEDLQSAALIFCVVAVLSLAYYAFVNRRAIGLEQVWGVALISALFIPMVMPKMHDRYFFMAEMLAILYAARYPKRFFVPVCVILASLICYAPFLMRQWAIPSRLAIVLNGVALLAVGYDVYRSMRAAKAAGEGYA